MRIEQLRYLVEIANTGTFTTAAERLHIAQPSISQSISALESELGISLLIRTRTGAELTPDGLSVVNHSRKILEEIKEIYAISQSSQSESKSIAVMAGVIPIATILPQAVASLKNTFGEINVTIREGSTSLAESMLSQHSIDLAIVPYIDTAIPNGFTFIPLFSTHLMAIVNNTSPLASKKHLSFCDIQPYPVALGSEDYVSGSNIIDKLKQFGNVNVSLRSQNIYLIKEHVLRSNLVGLIYGAATPTGFANTDCITCIPLDESIDLNFGILTQPRYAKNTLIKRLVEELKKASTEYQNILNQHYS